MTPHDLAPHIAKAIAKQHPIAYGHDCESIYIDDNEPVLNLVEIAERLLEALKEDAS